MNINLYELPKGWQESFGSDLLKDITYFYISIPRERQKYFTILQIKEKYGQLRIYHTCHEDDIDDFEWIIKKYETIARETCVRCGKTKEENELLCKECENLI